MLELAKEKFLPTTLLSQSLEAAIAAQLVSDNVAIGKGQSIGNVRQPSGVLASRVEQLIDQTNIEEIKIEIINQQIIIKQLLQQKQFISQQLQTILAELVILQQQGASVVQLQQLQQVQHQLQQQEKQIVVSTLARQQVIQQLEQALVEQQLNLQQNVKAEQVQQIQRWSAGPWLQRVGQTGPVWGPWSTVGNMWRQGNLIN
ncbi:protein elav-like [Anthonomus grandis grandis]|uniref:protein elav-like n=1 Tax=Anthonomus grandis grandis TaxID=2921223 RepID=UPI002164FD51|nr:protein elav-like [Anthonomus grandis grandis]